MHKRKHRTITVPHAVYERVRLRLTVKGRGTYAQ
jgi:hypothetical protein